MSLTNDKREAAKTREDIKKERKAQAAEGNARRKRIRVRILPIWLRIILIAFLLFVSASAGAAVGYSVMGNGSAKDIFKKETWTHIVDLVKKSE